MTAPLLTEATAAQLDAADIATIEDGRAVLDALDDQLLDLLARRRTASTRVQQLRVDAGGSRVEHSRENAILRRYSEALGDSGADLALAVLAHCRGRRTG
jgi:chorismate mutase